MPAHRRDFSSDIERAEECASQVVSVIQRCVHEIRSIPEFAANAKLEDIQHIKLFHELESNGLVKEVETVRELVHSTISTCPASTVDRSTLTTQRALVVHIILIPLIQSLFYCYEILDKEIQAPRSSTRKPLPPKGMLSIQNYTDIAALLEFLVCTSALPNLQPHVLASVQDRARYSLPKSLAGRIPYRSLLWATSTTQGTSAPIQTNELQQTAMTVGRLILLDRFRPMLLPRHLVDVYAAVFQAEEEELSHSAYAPDNEVSPEYRLFRENIPSGFATRSKEKSAALAVDAYIHARAYQALLFRGTKAPVWLRQRVSLLLTSLAVKDLAAIVQVFVKEGTSSPEHMTGASMRLAIALTSNPSSGTHPSNYFGLLCQQLLGLLDEPSNGSEAHGDAGVATIRAVEL